MNSPRSAQSLQGFSRLRWRLRRACSLVASHRGIARFAGGYVAAASIAFELLRARGLGALLGWATTAAAHGRFLDAKRYRAWLKAQPRPDSGGGSVLVVASTVGIGATWLSAYLGLLAAELRRLQQEGNGGPAIACVLVTTAEGEAAFAALRHAARLNVHVAVSEAPTLRTLLEAARVHARESDYVALMKPGYLPGVVAARGEDPDALVYGDEDRVDAAGQYSMPSFKPSLSPDLLLARDYLGCLVLPSDVAAALPEESEDYHSLVLRLVERASVVEHVDAVLAHRFVPTPGMDEAARPAGYLGDFLRHRYGAPAKVVPGCAAAWRCEFGHRSASVSVILPTRDRLPLLRNCIKGIFDSNRGEFEVVVLDNESTEPETLDWLTRAGERWPNLKVVSAPGPFNWSRLNNLGMAHAQGDVFVFLNNDTEPRSQHWLARLADVALRPDAGAVGALLLYASGRIQHAGVVLGEGRWADHIYRGDFPSSSGHVFVSPSLPRNVSAVTGACMALSRRTVQRIGPFDEEYVVAGSDVEICLRALKHGLLNVYLPDVVLLHLESQTRGRRDPASDVARLVALLQANNAEDPYFSRHLSAAPLYLTRRSAGRDAA